MTDSGLLKLWRKVVVAKPCFYCGAPSEPHHHIRRSNKVLRWDYRNGIPFCHKHHMNCHEYGDVYDYACKRWYWSRYLKYMKNINYKDYLANNGITEKEFMDQMAKELKERLSELL